MKSTGGRDVRGRPSPTLPTTGTTMTRSPLIFVFALALGCSGERSKDPERPHSNQSAVKSPNHRALCTTEIPPTAPADARLRNLSLATTKHPSSADAWLALGFGWVGKARASADPGFFLHADACASIVLELQPENSAALGLRGMVYLNDHRFREARELAEKILAKDPDDRNAWGILSDALLELGDLDGAERAAQRMLDLRPDLASYARAGYLRWMRGDRAGAKLFGDRAIRAGTESSDPEPVAWALVQTALVFWHEGDYAGADAGFDLALERFGGYPPALVGKARVAIASGRFADAVRHARSALERNQSVETRCLLGDAQLLAGDLAGASETWDRVVSEGRLHDRRTLSLFYARQKQHGAEAVELARQEHRDRPGSYSKDALAWALYRAGELGEARALSEQVMGVGTPDARFLYHAGAIRMAAGDVTSGKELVRRALRLNPAFDPFEAKEAETLVGSGA
jgi:tetratricopeptide (TPR) repeat protein